MAGERTRYHEPQSSIRGIAIIGWPVCVSRRARRRNQPEFTWNLNDRPFISGFGNVSPGIARTVSIAFCGVTAIPTSFIASFTSWRSFADQEHDWMPITPRPATSPPHPLCRLGRC